MSAGEGGGGGAPPELPLPLGAAPLDAFTAVVRGVRAKNEWWCLPREFSRAELTPASLGELLDIDDDDAADLFTQLRGHGVKTVGALLTASVDISKDPTSGDYSAKGRLARVRVPGALDQIAALRDKVKASSAAAASITPTLQFDVSKSVKPLLSYSMLEFAKPTSFDALTGRLLALRKAGAEAAFGEVPVIHGGMGVGKTRLAWEAATAFATKQYGHSGADVFDQAPGSRVALYVRFDSSVGPLQKEVLAVDESYRHDFVLAVVLAVGFGNSFAAATVALAPRRQLAFDFVKSALLTLGVRCVVVHLDEFQVDSELAKYFIRGCAVTGANASFNVLPILSGLQVLSINRDSLSGSKWTIHNLMLEPFNLAGDDGDLLLDEFLKAVGTDRHTYDKSRALQTMFQDAGGYPRHTNVLASIVRLRPAFVQADGRVDPGSAAKVYDEVVTAVTPFTSKGRWESLGDVNLELARDVALTVLADAIVRLDSRAGGYTFNDAVIAGIVGYREMAPGSADVRLVMPMFGALALAQVLKSQGVFVLPDDPQAANPFNGGYGGLEVLAMAGVYARLLLFKRRGRETVMLEELRPGAQVVGSLALKVHVPDQVCWRPRSDDLSGLTVGMMQRTSTRGAGLDGALVLEVVEANEGAPASASTTQARGVVFTGVQVKSADDELPTDRSITTLWASEIEKKVLPQVKPRIAAARKELGGNGQRFWAVLDVVSDRLGAKRGYANLKAGASKAGINQLLVTTRANVDSALGRVMASRKRLRGPNGKTFLGVEGEDEKGGEGMEVDE